MFTKEERDRMRQELLASFRPQPPPPKPTPAEKAQERFSQPQPREAVAQQAAASAERLAEVMREDTYEARRRRQEARELAEFNDPRNAYQRELDRFMEASRVIETEYVEIAGFREPRYRTSCHRGRGDPDYGVY
jgi:hypothetical protein